MKERPIMFKAAMVRAILENRKTQTRRLVKFTDSGRVKRPGSSLNWHIEDPNAAFACPYGMAWDRLWVRETFADTTDLHVDDPGWVYRATDPDWSTMEGFKWRPSIFMPRAASRLNLGITGVRVERLNQISDEDAMAEGIRCYTAGDILAYAVSPDSRDDAEATARMAFRALWQSINGADSWDANPWVWVVNFERLES